MACGMHCISMSWTTLFNVSFFRKQIVLRKLEGNLATTFIVLVTKVKWRDQFAYLTWWVYEYLAFFSLIKIFSRRTEIIYKETNLHCWNFLTMPSTTYWTLEKPGIFLLHISLTDCICKVHISTCIFHLQTDFVKCKLTDFLLYAKILAFTERNLNIY